MANTFNHTRTAQLSVPALLIQNVTLLSVGVIWLFAGSALVGFSMGYADWFLPKTPLNLGLGFLLMLFNVPMLDRRAILTFIFCFIVGMGAEIAGVHTGQIFGEYFYGDNLGVKFWGVPLMIGIYWAVLVIITSQIARSWTDNIWKASTVGAMFMVGQDFFMEQMAGKFDFWHFAEGVAPIDNYIAWFVIAYILHTVAFKLIPKGGVIFSYHLLLSQIAFFAVSYFIL